MTIDSRPMTGGGKWPPAVISALMVVAGLGGAGFTPRFIVASDPGRPTAPKDAATAGDETRRPEQDEWRERARGAFGSLQPVKDAGKTELLVQLGQALFWDERLSATGKVACASCHSAEDWGADRRRFSVDAKGQLTKRHSQTVFNAVLQPSLRWVADRKSAAEQAEKSLTGSMGFQEATEVVPLLQQFDYAPRFQAAFPQADNPLTPGHYAQAIAAYEQTLRTPAPFDQYLEGEDEVLSPAQLRGLQTFFEIGCADCHAGPLLGGEQMQVFGVYRDYWLATGSERRDAGRFEATQEPADRNLFRVAMLRNIARTAPYFHDGSVADLEQAVRIMADVQLGQELTAAQTNDLVRFLESLSGEIPDNYRDPRTAADGPSAAAESSGK